jgi:ankyrin repeat protein
MVIMRLREIQRTVRRNSTAIYSSADNQYNDTIQVDIDCAMRTLNADLNVLVRPSTSTSVTAEIFEEWYVTHFKARIAEAAKWGKILFNPFPEDAASSAKAKSRNSPTVLSKRKQKATLAPSRKMELLAQDPKCNPSVLDMIRRARSQGMAGFSVDYPHFFAACETNDISEIIALVVQCKADVNFNGRKQHGGDSMNRNNDIADDIMQEDVAVKHFTPLMVAANIGNAKACETLLALKANVNAQAEDGSTALLLASFKNHAQVVRHLMRSRQQLDVSLSQKDSGANALFVACQEGHANVVKELLAGNKHIMSTVKRIINKPVESGAFPLYIAAACDHPQVITLLAGIQGIDLDKYDNVLLEADATNLHNETRSRTSQSALFAAVQMQHVDSITQLMLAGADMHAQPKDTNISPLMLAVYCGFHGIANVLLEYGGCDDTSVIVGSDVAAFIGDFKMLGLLIRAGMDPHQMNDSSESPLALLKVCHGLELEEALAIDPVAQGTDPTFPKGMEIVTADQAKNALRLRLRKNDKELDKAWLETLLRDMNFELVLGPRFRAFADLVFHRMNVDGTQVLSPDSMGKVFFMVYTLHHIHLHKGMVPDEGL